MFNLRHMSKQAPYTGLSEESDSGRFKTMQRDAESGNWELKSSGMRGVTENVIYGTAR